MLSISLGRPDGNIQSTEFIKAGLPANIPRCANVTLFSLLQLTHPWLMNVATSSFPQRKSVARPAAVILSAPFMLRTFVANFESETYITTLHSAVRRLSHAR
jgi:hypothetical protein